MLSTIAEPGPTQDVADVLVVPEAERADRALARRRQRGGGTKGRSAVPVCHGFCSTPCQQAKTRRPPGRSPARMAPNAASGSSKNITPSWLTARSKGSGPRPSVCTSATTNVTFVRAGLRRPGPGPAPPAAGDVEPDHPPRRAPRLGQGDRLRTAAAPDVADPLTAASAATASAGAASGPRSAAPDRATRPPTGRRSSASIPSRWPQRQGNRPTRLRPVRVGLVILPSDRWTEARRQWEWADRAGFHTAWTYDHIRWGGMPDGPWHAARARARRRGRRHRARPAGHPGRHAELPPSRHAGPRRPRAR